uniref:Uncharacterized protein n=1 Tax=Proboscia inermis TaxID=420281 RepID=A0A7S0CDU2_9STRA|mmetsp:Transcript_424/g.444  ORF Transcript_424/g.444 Transcript_424/m.444 type:complete len:152 (+) Transcript_424:95-550(+)
MPPDGTCLCGHLNPTSLVTPVPTPDVTSAAPTIPPVTSVVCEDDGDLKFRKSCKTAQNGRRMIQPDDVLRRGPMACIPTKHVQNSVKSAHRIVKMSMIIVTALGDANRAKKILRTLITPGVAGRRATRAATNGNMQNLSRRDVFVKSPVRS